MLRAQLRDHVRNRERAPTFRPCAGHAVFVDDLVARAAAVLDDAHRALRYDFERPQRALDRMMSRDLSTDQRLDLLLWIFTFTQIEIDCAIHRFASSKDLIVFALQTVSLAAPDPCRSAPPHYSACLGNDHRPRPGNVH